MHLPPAGVWYEQHWSLGIATKSDWYDQPGLIVLSLQLITYHATAFLQAFYHEAHGLILSKLDLFFWKNK